MKVMDQGNDKVKKICEALREETIKPAQQEAEMMIKAAEKQAETIIMKAEEEGKERLEKARRQIEEERGVLASGLNMACKLAIGALKQAIEEKILGRGLALMSEKQAEAMTEKFIDAIAGAVKGEKEVEVVLDQSVSKEKIAQAILTLGLKESSVVQVRGVQAGVKVKFKEDRLTLDLTSRAITELLATYMRADFRKLIFGAEES